MRLTAAVVVIFAALLALATDPGADRRIASGADPTGSVRPATPELPGSVAAPPAPTAVAFATATATATPAASYYPTERRVLFAINAHQAVEVPIEFARLSLSLIYCESRWDTNAVGRVGELGWLQLHPVHFPRMRGFGLDPHSEADRVWFAGNVIWQESGSAPWSCAR